MSSQTRGFVFESDSKQLASRQVRYRTANYKFDRKRNSLDKRANLYVGLQLRRSHTKQKYSYNFETKHWKHNV